MLFYTETSRETVTDKGGAELIVIKSDSLKRSNDSANRGETRGCDLVSRFYADVDRSFTAYCKNTLARQADRASAGRTDVGRTDVGRESFRPFAAVKKYTITLENEKYLSVVTDASFYNGEGNRKLRTAQNWDINSGLILSFYDIFNPKAEKKLVKLICEKLTELVVGGSRALFSDYERLTARHFRRENFCLTTEGLGIFFPEGALSAEERPFSVILKYLELEEGKFLKTTIN